MQWQADCWKLAWVASLSGVFLLLLVSYFRFYGSQSDACHTNLHHNRITPSLVLANPHHRRTTLPPGYVTNRYVTFGRSFDDGRRIGNQLFNFAAMLYVAELTGRQPVLFNLTYTTDIEKYFDIGVFRHPEELLCPCRQIGESQSLMYDKKFEELAFDDENDNRTIWMLGFFQSWKYLRSIKRQLLKHLVFKPEITTFVDKFLVQNTPKNWMKGFIRIGIHVRRSDVVEDSGKVEFGYTFPNTSYFDRAMTHFVEKYPTSRIQFVVASDDIDWCQKNFDAIMQRINEDKASNHNVVYSINHSTGEDLALLASCDHAIMSTGTYGWWAAWLAGGTTIYYADWPRNGSSLASKFNRDDFFPPSWIGLYNTL